MRRLFVMVVLVMGLAMVLGEPAVAQGTLTGETLTCGSVPTTRACDPANPNGGNQPTITERSCTTAHAGYSFTLEDGTAFGPYSGTFDESGSVELGAEQTLPPFFPFVGQRPVIAFEARFTIDSATGPVVGRKRLTAAPPIAFQNRGFCRDLGGENFALFTNLLTTANLCYSARLPDGTVDRGTTRVSLGRASGTPNEAIEGDGLLEQFVSNPSVDCAFEAETKQDCKDAYELYGFENQGDCVSFIATGGKNEPGKNNGPG